MDNILFAYNGSMARRRELATLVGKNGSNHGIRNYGRLEMNKGTIRGSGFNFCSCF